MDDNRTYGCHLLPAEVKATLEVAGVLLIALVGLLTRGNKKSAVSLLGVIACVLLATTASGAEDNGGSTESNDSSTQDCAHPAWAQVYDLGSSTTRCTLCGTEWVDEE